MADEPNVTIVPDNMVEAGDVDMMNTEIVEVVEADTGANTQTGDEVVEERVGEEAGAADDNLPPIDEEDKTLGRVTFLDYVQSPIIQLAVGVGENAVVLNAHQALLARSPFFEEACAKFMDDGTRKIIELPNEDLDAMGCFLEWIYTGEYYPQRVDGTRGLVRDPDMPEIDPDGEQLLKHARVYTLASQLGVDSLKSLAHQKIHCVNSSARGEIAYARFVYANTAKDDHIIRRPVATFWAQRSHVLRKEAESEFMELCLEFPQFGFDVLSRVLDEKAKRAEEKEGRTASASQGTQGTPAGASSRKRARHSQI